MYFNFDFLRSTEADNLYAFCINDTNYTYAYFKKRIFTIAASIKKEAIKNENIGIFTFNHIDTYAAAYAAWITGNIYVPIHHTYPENRVSEILSQASIKLIISSNEAEVKTTDAKIINTNTLTEQDYEEQDIYRHKAEDLLYILFTSGSTGKPKGVQISFENLNSFMEHVYSMQMGLKPGDRYLQMFELTFDLSVVSFVLPIQNYGTVYTVSDEHVKYLEIYRLLEEYSINFAIIVPSVLALLRPYFEDIDLPDLKNVALSGEAVPLKLTEDFQKCCPNAQFYNFYGPTECTIFCTSFKIPQNNIPAANGIVSIGMPTKNLVYKLIDEDGKEADPEAKAELYMGGSQVSPGYVNNPEMNKNLFLNIDGSRFYKTGDLVMMKDNLLFYLGRKDQQVKIQGYRIELMEVEHLCSDALKTETAVVAVKDERGFDNLVLFVKNWQQEQKIANILTQCLPKYMMPNKIVELKKFPLNDNGKLDRKALKQNL